ncbi:AraC family transcriptional regulator [Paenibacillus sabinae]|uniref:AraC family transcriptional regulator n=1 Tax=Paenibacillus sabinae T27 TaxID=1268072 RepID=X4Z7I2_9BACL|nr:AraC family transcriptional regulator [Paenibacillus sabinae]AHV95696.1 AraC family transcriptional regulator [Paenibacillus sabinae T27]
MLAVNIDLVPRITWMGFVSYKSPWVHFKRNVNEYIMYLIKSGELHMVEDGKEYILKKGDVLLLEPNLDHEGLEKHTCDYYYIHFKHPDMAPVNVEDPESFAKRFIFEDQGAEEDVKCCFPKHFTITDKSVLSQIYNSLNEMLQLYRRKNYNRSLTALKLSELFILLSRESLLEELQNSRKRTTKAIVKAHGLLDYIHTHYQSKITSRDIEALFECNFDYLNRTFNKLTGHSITHYINKVRIDQAQELLQATHLSIGEIAYLVGFGDIYYFSKVFKKYAGLSPAAYYKKIREEE